MVFHSCFLEINWGYDWVAFLVRAVRNQKEIPRLRWSSTLASWRLTWKSSETVCWSEFSNFIFFRPVPVCKGRKGNGNWKFMDFLCRVNLIFEWMILKISIKKEITSTKDNYSHLSPCKRYRLKYSLYCIILYYPETKIKCHVKTMGVSIETHKC